MKMNNVIATILDHHEEEKNRIQHDGVPCPQKRILVAKPTQESAHVCLLFIRSFKHLLDFSNLNMFTLMFTHV